MSLSPLTPLLFVDRDISSVKLIQVLIGARGIFDERETDHVSYWGASTDISTDTSVDISVDTSVDTRPSIGRYIGRVSTDVSTDNPIGRNTPILDRYLTDISPIFHRCFTDALHRSILDRHATGS